MRLAIAICGLLLAACGPEPSFDERYAQVSNDIRNRADAIDRDVRNSADNAEPETRNDQP